MGSVRSNEVEARQGRAGATAAVRCAEGDFVLAVNRLARYDVSACVSRLDADWLRRACAAIKEFEAILETSSWLTRYVSPFCDLMLDLESYSARQDVEFIQWSKDPQRWAQFLDALRRRLVRQGVTPESRPYKMKDLVVRVLATRQLLPAGSVLVVKKEMPPPKKSTKANFDFERPKPPLPQPRYVHIIGARLYDFRPYLTLGERFVDTFAQGVAAHADMHSDDQANDFARTAENFLEFLREQATKDAGSQFFEGLAAGQQLSADDWETLAHAWRQAQKDKAGRQLVTADMRVGELRATFEHLANTGVLPPIELPGFLGAKRKTGRATRPGLGQLSSKTVHIPLQLQEFVSELAASERAPALTFINALCAEIGLEAASQLTSDGLAKEIVAMNDRRLAEIRGCAERTFIHWRKHWERGQALLAACEFKPKQIADMLDPLQRTKGEIMRASSELFSKQTHDAALSNLLMFVLNRTGGRTIRMSGTASAFAVAFGGRPVVQAYIHPHPQATLALLLMLLVDSGANQEVVRGTPLHCWGSGKTATQREVRFGIKRRAGGKRITDYLDLKPQAGQLLSSVQALEQYTEMTHRMRALGKAAVAEPLFVVFSGRGRVEPLKLHRSADFLETFIKANPPLQAYRFTASSIRVSVLLSEHFHHPRGVEAAQARGDHVDPQTTNDSYSGSYPNQLVYSQKMREFVDRFQAIVVVTIDGVAAKLGLSQEQFDWLVSDAARTGLGFACLNSKAGIQPGTVRGKQCTELQNCHGCSVRWVVATVDNIADMILLNEHLRQQQRELAESQFDLFEKKWMSTLALTEVALKKFAQGETAALLTKARAAADARRLTYQPFPLW